MKATASKSDNIISTPARERPSLTLNIRVGPLKITAKVGVGILVRSHGNGSALGKPLPTFFIDVLWH